MKKLFLATLTMMVVMLPSCSGSKTSKENEVDDKTKNEIISYLDSTMVLVDGGTFIMGANNGLQSTRIPTCVEEMSPEHEVTLDSYYICKFEVTQKLWSQVMRDTPSVNFGDNRPVENVSWKDCKEFIKKLNEITGMKFRLPTEAEWEFAACGGNKSQGFIWAGSDDAYEVGCIYRKSEYATEVVGSFPPNELGLYDMTGNVWEWCEDNYGDYTAEPQKDPLYKDFSNVFVRRGGSWVNARRSCENKARFGDAGDTHTGAIGLRLAISVKDFKKKS